MVVMLQILTEITTYNIWYTDNLKKDRAKIVSFEDSQCTL
jgi:hypothetical protein